MTDAFTEASDLYRRAQSFAAKPLPLLAGEVAEFPKRRLSIVIMAVQLVACSIPVLLIMAVL